MAGLMAGVMAGTDACGERGEDGEKKQKAAPSDHGDLP
jgi:hypothetical protein